MVTDPVCKMQVNEGTAALVSRYQNVTYYFCSPACKEVFDVSPEDYVGDTDILGRDSKGA